MRKPQRYKPRAFIVMLSVLLAMVGVFSVVQTGRVAALENEVSAGYQKAFYETVKLMSGIEVNLEKLLITAEKSQQQDMLSDIARQSDAVLSDLSQLPADFNAISGAIKFVNQIGDYSRTLFEKVASGGTISEGDENTLSILHKRSIALNEELDGMLNDILYQGASVLLAARNTNNTLLSEDAPGELFESSAEYPVLLYDGPFSDGRNNNALLGLTGTEIDANAALETAKRFIGESRVKSIRQTGESAIPVQCYEIDAETDDGTLSIAITKRGGQALYMMTSASPDDVTLTPEQCADLAARFLTERGFMNMEMNYWQQTAGLITCNFAAVQDGTLLYPDLIKVQLSMKTGQVVGYEARNYLANHVTRDLPAPALSETEAQAIVGSRLTIERARLCVIPLNIGEAMCYEFTTSVDNARYLIYIDAYTGRELSVLKVVEDQDGQLAI